MFYFIIWGRKGGQFSCLTRRADEKSYLREFKQHRTYERLCLKEIKFGERKGKNSIIINIAYKCCMGCLPLTILVSTHSSPLLKYFQSKTINFINVVLRHVLLAVVDICVFVCLFVLGCTFCLLGFFVI